MSELISKEALRIAVLDTDWNDDTDEDVALDMIDDAPTVEERRHGHWIIRTIFSEGAKEIVCSNCGENGFWREKPSYCPFCGAKMDEVSEDDR